MRFTLFLSSIALVAASAIPSSILISPLEGYVLSEAQWIGEFQGTAYNLSGTVQDVYAHFQTIDPSYVLPARSKTAERETSDSGLEARFSSSTNCCYEDAQGDGWAYNSGVDGGIDFLQALNYNIIGTGNTCIRISCVRNAAIVWCNQISQTFNQNSGWLGQHARSVQRSCTDSQNRVCGQNFDAGGYFVYVLADHC